MKTTALALVGALSAAGLTISATPALADGHIEKAKKLTVDNTIDELMSNKASAAVLEKHLPGIGSHMMYDFFKGMTLKELAPKSNGLVTDETIAKIASDLKALAG